MGEGKKMMRLIFDGHVKLSEFEKGELRKFQEEALKRGDHMKHLLDNNIWTDMNQMRFL